MRFTLIALALVGCGGGSSGSSIDVKLADTEVAAIRTGDTWKPIEKTATGDATIELDGPTMLAIVCDDPTFFNYYTVYLGPGVDDTEPLDLSCTAPNTAADVTVTIAAPDTTDVAIYLSSTFGNDQLRMPAGTYDVIAFDDSTMPPRFEIRRDVPLTADTTLTFDLASTGSPMVATQINVAGASSGETLSRTTRLQTARRTFASMIHRSSSGWMFPASALVEGDHQSVAGWESNETTGSRWHRREVAGNETAIDLVLPEGFTSVTATASSATWQGGQWEGFYFGINDPSFERFWDVTVLPEWALAGGDVETITIPDPTGIPGWQSAWNLGATADYSWYFSANRRDDPDRFSATQSGTL